MNDVTTNDDNAGVRSTRERLLDAAVDLLLEDAGVDFTTGRLAARAGIVQSAFYNHFGSVGEAKRAALDELREQLTESIAVINREVTSPHTTTASDIERVLLGAFEQTKARPQLFRLLVHRSHAPDVAAVVEQMLDLLQSAIVEAILDGTSTLAHMEAADANIVAELIVGHTLSVIRATLRGDDTDRLAATTAIFAAGGLFAVAGLSPRDEGSERRADVERRIR